MFGAFNVIYSDAIYDLFYGVTALGVVATVVYSLRGALSMLAPGRGSAAPPSLPVNPGGAECVKDPGDPGGDRVGRATRSGGPPWLLRQPAPRTLKVPGPLRRDLTPAYALLLVQDAIMVLALVYWSSRLLGSQGRLMFPAIAALSCTYAVSLRILGPRARAVTMACVAGVLALLAFHGAWNVIPAQYP